MQTFAKQLNVWLDFISAMVKSCKKLNTSNVVSSLKVCSSRKSDLLSYNSLFVGQLCEDKSLTQQITSRADIFLIETKANSLPNYSYFRTSCDMDDE